MDRCGSPVLLFSEICVLPILFGLQLVPPASDSDRAAKFRYRYFSFGAVAPCRCHLHELVSQRLF